MYKGIGINVDERKIGEAVPKGRPLLICSAVVCRLMMDEVFLGSDSLTRLYAEEIDTIGQVVNIEVFGGIVASEYGLLSQLPDRIVDDDRSDRAGAFGAGDGDHRQAVCCRGSFIGGIRYRGGLGAGYDSYLAG